MPARFCIRYVSRSGRPSSGHRTGKNQFSPHSLRRVVPKNILTIGRLHSFPMLVRSCLKSCMLGFSIMWTKSFQMSKLDLRKAEESEIKLPNSLDHRESKGIPKKTSTSVSSTMLKPLTVCIITNCEKLLKSWEYQTILSVSWETCMQVKKQQLWTCMEQFQSCMEQTDWFKIEKGVRQGCLLSSCLVNLYDEHIMRNAWLDEL